jgi:dienelactone hydrolase
MLKWFGLAGLALWLAGTVAVVTAMSWGIVQESFPLELPDGTSICGTLYRPKEARAELPAAVVVHGTALTHQSCAPGLAIPLARNGYLVLAVDLRGHGHSGGALSRDELGAPLAALSRLANHPEIDVAVDAIKQHPLFASKHDYAVLKDGAYHSRAIHRIALVGHSRGGWAAANVGFRRGDVDGVVSIGAAPGTCDVSRPHNFLILTGKHEELCTGEKCAESIMRATGGVVHECSVPFGEFWAGTARLLQEVSGATHLTELGDPAVTRYMVQWLGSSLNIDAGPVPAAPLTIVIAGVLGASVGGFLTCTWVLRRLSGRLLPPANSIAHPWQKRSLGGFLAAVMLIGPAVAFVSSKLETGPAHFAAPAVVLLTSLAGSCLGIAAWTRFRTPPSLPEGPEPWIVAKGLTLGLMSLGLAFVWLGAPWASSWADLLPSGRRLLLGLTLLPLLFPSALALAFGLKCLIGGDPEARGTRLAQGLVWTSVAAALWGGFVFLAADHWPLFSVPAGFLCASCLVPLPLWLLPSRPGMTLARALSHAAAAAWLLACHLPFVYG